MNDEEVDDKAEAAGREARRNWLAKWLWVLVLSPPVIVGYFLLDFETYASVMLLFTGELSVIALALANHAAQKGAEAKAAGYQNP